MRAIGADEFGTVAELYNAVSQHYFGENVTNEEEMRVWYTTPGVEVARDVRVIEDGGELIGYADVFDENRWHTRYWSEVIVDPRRGNGDTAHALIEWCEQRVREDAGEDAFFRVFVSEQESTVWTALEERGYRRIRSSFRMLIGLDEEPPEPDWPDGVAVRAFREDEERELYTADQEAFADHWEHVEEPFDQWRHWTVGREGFDLSLIFVVTDGDEIAGYAICRPYDGEPDLAWVDRLGVRRPWRKRGVALALLRHAFREFRDRGFGRAGLGVDAESLTGAVRLYERAGMHVARRHDCYELRM